MARPVPAPWARRSPPPARRGLAPELREAVWARCGGLCELCGDRLNPASWHAHHRKLRSRGGEDSVTNLAGLHPRCHDRAHSHVAWAEQAGFIVPAHADPVDVRLGLHGETWVRLAPDGTYLPEAA